MAKVRPGKRERAAFKLRLEQQCNAPAHDPNWSRVRSCLDVVPTVDYCSDYRRMYDGPKSSKPAIAKPALVTQVTKRAKRTVETGVNSHLLVYDAQLNPNEAFERQQARLAHERAREREKKYFDNPDASEM